MYEGSPVSLQMVKIISADAIFDNTIRHCKVHRYDVEDDCIYLKLKENDLTVISLDARYGCHISTKKEVLYCTGVVKERFQSEEGNMLVFRIEDGFYSASESGGAR